MTFPVAAEGADAAESARPRLRLEFLDGLRGLAALYVVLFHGSQGAVLDDVHVDGDLLSRLGHPAVSVFIVLSGFCLMLPVIRSGDGRLRGGVSEYFKRRARRILPPYYAALGLGVLVLVAGHLARFRSASALHDKVMAAQLSAGSLVSHLFLVHNFNQRWVETIDVPLWSVATEWQIYFLFPFVLLPLWRRFGGPAALTSGFVVGLLPHYLLAPGHNFDWACPWYAGLFAGGMVGAAAAFSSQPAAVVRRERLPWASVAALLFSFWVLLNVLVPDVWIAPYVWETDALMGAATLCLILCGTVHATKPPSEPRPWAIRALETRPALLLGAFSYSLYLVHYPVLNKIALLLSARHLPLAERLVGIYAVGVPLAVGLSYLFFLAFEKPFVMRRASARPAEIVLR